MKARYFFGVFAAFILVCLFFLFFVFFASAIRAQGQTVAQPDYTQAYYMDYAQPLASDTGAYRNATYESYYEYQARYNRAGRDYGSYTGLYAYRQYDDMYSVYDVSYNQGQAYIL